MDKSTLHNKMITLGHDTKIKFNVAMHGFNKDQVVRYNSVPNDKKVLIRRRFADKDGLIEVVTSEIKVETKAETKPSISKDFSSKHNQSKPNNGSKGPSQNKQENN